MARLNAKWDNFNRRGNTWDHFWMDYQAILTLLVSDSVSLSDLISSVSVFNKTFSDSVTTSELLSKQFSINRSLSDSTSISDNKTNVNNFSRQYSDSVSLSDSDLEQLAKSLSLSDNISVSDVQILEKAFNKAFGDSITLNELLSKQSSFDRNITDATNISDSESESTNKSIQDVITTIESFTKSLGIFRSLNDNITLTDQFQNVVDRNRQLSDSISVSETLKNNFNKNIDDSVNVSDNVQKSVNKALNDQITTSEQLSKSLSLNKSLVDSLNISEQLSESKDINKDLSSQTNVSDAFDYNVGAYLIKDLDDSLSVVDEEQIKRDIQAFIQDSLSISDNKDAKDVFKNEEDFINLTDEFETEKIMFEILEDEITLSNDFEVYVTKNIMGNIRSAAPPNLIGKPNVDFDKEYFDSLIWNKGYDVYVYQAIECPCKSQGSTNLSGCQNCLGLGWVFINPIETKAIITSINKDTKYKYWSPELKGTIAITLRDIERISFMDKIVVKNKTSVLSEIRAIKTVTVSNVTQKFIFLSYPAMSVNNIFMFSGSTNPLIRLTEDQFEISLDNPYVIKLKSGITYPSNFNGVVSVDYNFNVQYNVVDIPHDLRVSAKVNDKGQIKQEDFPVQAIAQRSNYVNGDSVKYDGTGIQDNSYL